MIVLFVLLVVGGLSFLCPYKYIKLFFVFSGLIISGIFLFYTPPVTDDLYRYYQLFDTVEHLSFNEYLSGAYGTDDWLINYMLNDYKSNAFVFSAILFGVSRIGIREIMPFLFAMLTYIPLFMLVYEICDDRKCTKGTMCLCFLMILTGIDVRFVSCLRNLSAYSIFAYTLYKDTVKKDNRIKCLLLYVVSCGLHLSCLPLILFRLLSIVINGRLKWVIVAILLFTKRLASLMVYLLGEFFSGNSYIMRLSEKIELYFIGRTNYNTNGAIFFIGTLVVVVLVYYAAKKDKIISTQYIKYGCVYQYIAAFTIGCVSQYDVLMRNCGLMIMLTIPFAAAFFRDRFYLTTNDCRFCLKQHKMQRDIVVAGGFFALLLMSIVFYTLFSYIPMDKCL